MQCMSVTPSALRAGAICRQQGFRPLAARPVVKVRGRRWGQIVPIAGVGTLAAPPVCAGRPTPGPRHPSRNLQAVAVLKSSSLLGLRPEQQAVAVKAQRRSVVVAAAAEEVALDPLER